MYPDDKYLVQAILIIVLAGAITFGLLAGLGVDRGVVAQLSVGYMPAIPVVAYILQRRSLARRSASPDVLIAHPSKFYISAWRLVIFGGITVFAVVQLGSGLFGLLAAIGGADVYGGIFIGSVAALLLTGFTAYRLGKWIGSRGRRLRLLIATCAILLGGLLSMLFTFMMGSVSAELRSFLMEVFGPSYRFDRTTLLEGLSPFVALCIPAAVGVWRGSRKRSLMYLMYLLRLVKSDVRQTISELAYEEVVRGHSDEEKSVV